MSDFKYWDKKKSVEIFLKNKKIFLFFRNFWKIKQFSIVCILIKNFNIFWISEISESFEICGFFCLAPDCTKNSINYNLTSLDGAYQKCFTISKKYVHNNKWQRCSGKQLNVGEPLAVMHVVQLLLPWKCTYIYK